MPSSLLALLVAAFVAFAAPVRAQLLPAQNLGGGSIPNGVWNFIDLGPWQGLNRLGMGRNWQSTGWVPYPLPSPYNSPMCPPQAGLAETLCLMIFSAPVSPVPLAGGCASWHTLVGAQAGTKIVDSSFSAFFLCQSGSTDSYQNRLAYPPSLSGYGLHFQSVSMLGNVQLGSSSANNYFQQVTVNNLSTSQTCEVAPGLHLVVSDGFLVVLP